MIILEKLGFIFYRRNRKLLVHLKASRHMWRMKQKESLKLFALIVEENIAQRNLMLFVMSREFEGNLQLPTHHNKMVYQRGKIEPSSTW